MEIKDLGSSNIDKMMGNISKLTNMSGIIGNYQKMPEITSFKTIDPFHKSLTTEEALKDESDYCDERFKIDEHHCEICDSSLEDGAYILKKSEKTLYFCSTKCINQFKDNGNYINDYELFEVSRCASFKCCLELGNLRRMCEKTKSLTNIDFVSSLSGVNFCEPAVAGQIQVSYAIYKHLQKVDEENSKLSEENTKLNKRTQFLTIVSTIMAVLTIVLTGISVVKSFWDKLIDYREELENINSDIHNEQKLLEAINQNETNIESKLSDIKKAINEKEIIVNTSKIEK